MSNRQEYNAHAQAWQERLKKGNNYAHRFLEKPAMASHIPDLTGKRVLTLGCGSGEELDLLYAKGATSIVGIDISEELILRARQDYPHAVFHVLSLEMLDSLPESSFDFVYSSLAMHYIPSWEEVFRSLSKLTTPRAQFLFSTHHPVKWGAQVTRGPQEDSFIMGYTRTKDGQVTIQGDYFNNRLIQDVWFGNMAVEYWHRPFEALFSDILTSDFKLVGFYEPKSEEGSKDVAPAFYCTHQQIPLFCIFHLEKNS